MKLQKIKYLMIGLGFFWIFCATIIGSLVGAKMNSIITHSTNGSWLNGLEKMFLVSAHAHMNLMSIITILFALALGFVWGQVSAKLLKFTILCNLVSMPVFVSGLLCASFFMGQYQFLFTGIIALGAIFYIISIGLISSMFFFCFLYGNR